MNTPWIRAKGLLPALVFLCAQVTVAGTSFAESEDPHAHHHDGDAKGEDPHAHHRAMMKEAPATKRSIANYEIPNLTMVDQQAIFIPLPNAEEGQSVATDLDPSTLVITNQLQLLNHQDSISLSR